MDFASLPFGAIDRIPIAVPRLFRLQGEERGRRSPGSGLARCEAGAVLVELAMVLPVLLGFLFGIIEIGRALSIQNSLQFATEAAARCAAINSTDCGTAANIQTYASSQVLKFKVPASDFIVSEQTCGHQVAINFQFRSLVSGLVDFSPTLSARACHP